METSEYADTIEVWRRGKYVNTYVQPKISPGAEIPNLRSPDYPPYLFRVRTFEENSDGTLTRVDDRVPNLRVVDQVTYDKLPRFLYRISHEGSAGSSSKGRFQSASVTDGLGHTNFSAFSPDEHGRNIYLHLGWYQSSNGARFHSPWISFTDSPLFAYWYGLNLKAQGKQNIMFHVIDTYTIRNPTIVAHSYSISKAYRVGAGQPLWWYKKMMGGTYTEFLVWNSIEVSSADEASFNSLLKAELNDFGTKISYPNTCALFGYTARVRNKGGYEKTVLTPSALRARLFDDEAELMYRRMARAGPGTEKSIRKESRATAFSLAKPRRDRRILDTSFPLDQLQFAAGLQVASLFERKFQLDFLIGFFALRTKFYYKDSIIEQIVTNTPASMIEGQAYYPTGLKSYKKKEVQIQQEIWFECAIQLGLQIFQDEALKIRSARDRPSRNLLGLVEASLQTGGTTNESQNTALINNGIYHRQGDSVQSMDDLDRELHNLDNRTRLSRKRKGRPTPRCNGRRIISTVTRPADNPLIKKKGGLKANSSDDTETLTQKIKFWPDIDTYSVDHALHEGIKEYLSRTSKCGIQLLSRERMELFGEIIDGDAAIDAGSDGNDNDDDVDCFDRDSDEEEEMHALKAAQYFQDEKDYLGIYSLDDETG